MKEDDILNLEHFEILQETDEDEPGFLASMIEGFETNGAELLEQLKESVASKNIEDYTFCAHKLKGLSGTLGASLLANLAGEAEQLSKSDPDFAKLEEILKKMDSAYTVCLEAIKKRHQS